MQVSSNSNNYQTLSTQNKQVTAPVQAEELKPQEQLKPGDAQEDQATQASQPTQTQQDAKPGVAVDYLAASSKKSQVEIYLAAATEGTSGSNDKTPSVIESLRDVQKQNKAVEAYAAYKTNQDNSTPTPY